MACSVGCGASGNLARHRGGNVFCHSLTPRSLTERAQVVERQIDELCARDEFEKAELLDVELQRLQERLRLVSAITNDGDDDDDDYDGHDDHGEDGGAQDGGGGEGTREEALVARPQARHSRVQLHRNSGRGSNRGSGVWQDIPLTPQPSLHKPRPPPPAMSTLMLEAAASTMAALSNQRVLDAIFSFLSPEELGRLCGVSRLWRERIEQDEIWQPLFRSEWQHEITPAPGTYKRWYGAMRSAPISWMSPILQQETVRHESLAGRVELRLYGQDPYMIAMTSEGVTVWDYSSLRMLHEIKQQCAFALGSGDTASGHDGGASSGVARLIGGDKKGSQWIVWDILRGQKIFSCPADDSAFSGGWYIVHRACVVVFRRQLQTLRGYVWNYESPNAADITSPLLAWELTGSYAMPKATRFGLLVTDFLRGLVRVAYDDGAVTVLLKEKPDDLDPRNARVRFSVDRSGTVVTRTSSARNAPVLFYKHTADGLALTRSVRLPVAGPGASVKLCAYSEDFSACFGTVQGDDDAKPQSALLWHSTSSDDGTLQSVRLALDLRPAGARLLDAAICNNVVAGLFGDLVSPSELYLWDARTGKELSRLVAELGQRPHAILRFTGLNACLLHKDGAITKLRVVGRRAAPEGPAPGGSACSLQ